ncbi:hypothetical protein ACJX0J_040872, partial [Zea mays]
VGQDHAHGQGRGKSYFVLNSGCSINKVANLVKLSTFVIYFFAFIEICFFFAGQRVPILGVIEPLYFLSLGHLVVWDLCVEVLSFGLNLLRYIFLIFSLQHIYYCCNFEVGISADETFRLSAGMWPKLDLFKWGSDFATYCHTNVIVRLHIYIYIYIYIYKSFQYQTLISTNINYLN